MSANVRTFRAPDSSSALAAVKAALGPDAILISTRTVEGGLFRRPLFDFASRFVPDLWVVAARELVPGTSVEPAGVIQVAHAQLESAAA